MKNFRGEVFCFVAFPEGCGFRSLNRPLSTSRQFRVFGSLKELQANDILFRLLLSPFFVWQERYTPNQIVNPPTPSRLFLHLSSGRATPFFGYHLSIFKKWGNQEGGRGGLPQKIGLKKNPTIIVFSSLNFRRSPKVEPDRHETKDRLPHL